MSLMESKACNTCKLTKRKCDKQTPACSRCSTKGLDCIYQASVTPYVLYTDNFPTPTEQSSLPSTQTVIPNSPTYPIPPLRTAWFTTPDTWTKNPPNPTDGASVRTSDAWKYITKLRGWITTWVGTGSNPFIHSRLHQTRPPTCIQDAYTAASSHVLRTSTTEEWIARILEDRAASLIQAEDSDPRTCYAHLSRVQALTVYTTLRLFDADIRQRHLAEHQLPVLRAWADQMLACARAAAEKEQLLIHGSDSGANSNSNTNCPGAFAFEQSVLGEMVPVARPDEFLWHSWILCESMRRTWLVAQMVCGIYTALQRGVSECPGGIMFSTQQGVWEASSALGWTRFCAEKSVGFMQRGEMRGLLLGSSPADVDEFTKTLMILDFGVEDLDEWGWKVGT